MIYNASYIYGLKDPSMMGYNMAHWFMVYLPHTINFGASIIVVSFSFHMVIFSIIIYLYILGICVLSCSSL